MWVPYIVIYFKKKLCAHVLLTFVIHDILNDIHYDNIISRNYEGLKNAGKPLYIYIIGEYKKLEQ
jgi:hypothetical protein